MNNVNPFPRKNIPAYLTVMSTMIGVSILLWVVYVRVKTGGFETSFFSEFSTELIFSVLMVMSGMMIMFIASLINLRKMKKGWEQMAQGQKNIRIPEVWCPVLTSAKEAAVQFAVKATSKSTK
ncbi:hypothetical protein [Algoriphagus sp.]|uniref:hypothetical protein n=1 Tax=Algoriphagus sp. TaxID=1872435 RepID=UPI00391B36FE